MENTHSAAKSEAEKWGKPAIPWFHNRWVSHGFSRCRKILYCNPKNRERKVGNIEILGKTSSNSHPRKSTFFQWLKTLTDKSDIVSDIPSGSVYGVCINNYIYIFWHSIWHSFWHMLWHSIWHSIWHLFWHTFWHMFWHSIWHLSRHSFCHSIWHLLWHSIWHSIWHSNWLSSL